MVVKLNMQRWNHELMRQMLTMQALADRAGVARSNLSSIYTRGTCRRLTAAKIAAALGIEPEELIA